MNDTRTLDPEMSKVMEAFQEEMAAEIERAAQDGRLAKFIDSLDEPLQRMSSFLYGLNRAVTAWLSENPEVIATAERFMANAALVASRIDEAAEEASERLKVVLKRSDHRAKLGWTFSSNLYFLDLLHLSKITDPVDADAFVLKLYEKIDPRLEAMEQRLRESPCLPSFSTVLQQCFAAIRRGEYAVTIPCLMAVLERVVIRLDPPDLRLLKSTKVRKKSTKVWKTLEKGGDVAKQAEQGILSAAIYLSLATLIVDGLWLHRPAADGSTTRVLSRNDIQHGCKEPPNKKIESIRLLHTIETALSLHKEIGCACNKSCVDHDGSSPHGSTIRASQNSNRKFL